jgi:hypothetical protein
VGTGSGKGTSHTVPHTGHSSHLEWDNICGFQLQRSLAIGRTYSCTCTFRLTGAFLVSNSRRNFPLTILELICDSQRHQTSSVYKLQETVSWKLSSIQCGCLREWWAHFCRSGAETLEDRARVHNVFLL